MNFGLNEQQLRTLNEIITLAKQNTAVNHRKFPKGGEIPERGRGKSPEGAEFVVKNSKNLNNRQLIKMSQSGLSNSKRKR